MIRVFVTENPACDFLTGVTRGVFTKKKGFELTSDAPHSSDVLIASHFGDGSYVAPQAVIVFFDGESGSDYSSKRDKPLSAAFSADIYVGPTANHAVLRDRGIHCEYVPFASLSFGQRKDHTPRALDLLSRNMVSKPLASRFCAYLAHNPIPHREAFFDALSLEAEKHGKCVEALGSCAGSHGGSTLTTSRFSNRWIDDAVKLLRPYRFAIAFENENVDGYVTEKLVNAYLAGCIPLYSGSRDAFDIFNRDSFLYLDEFNNWATAARFVMDVAADESRCAKLLSAPPLVPGAIARFFSWHPSVDGVLGERIRDAVRDAVARKRSANGLNNAG